MSDRRRRVQRRQACPAGWQGGGRPEYGRGYAQPGYDEGYDDPYADDEWYGSRGGERRRRVRLISPARVLLFVLVLIAGGVAVYGFLDRTALQLTIIIVGLGLLGVALLLLSLSLARAAAQLGRQGHGGKALFAALGGGICILGAAGSLSGAIVLGLLTA